jgi:hypothetical protein
MKSKMLFLMTINRLKTRYHTPFLHFFFCSSRRNGVKGIAFHDFFCLPIRRISRDKIWHKVQLYSINPEEGHRKNIFVKDWITIPITKEAQSHHHGSMETKQWPHSNILSRKQKAKYVVNLAHKQICFLVSPNSTWPASILYKPIVVMVI